MHRRPQCVLARDRVGALCCHESMCANMTHKVSETSPSTTPTTIPRTPTPRTRRTLARGATELSSGKARLACATQCRKRLGSRPVVRWHSVTSLPDQPPSWSAYQSAKPALEQCKTSIHCSLAVAPVAKACACIER